MQHTPQSSTRYPPFVLLALILLLLVLLGVCIFLIIDKLRHGGPGPLPTPTQQKPIWPGPANTPIPPIAQATTPAPQALTLTSVAQQMQATPTEPKRFLSSPQVVTDTAAQTPGSCSAPAGWVPHSVRQDETLYYLATSTGASVEEVKKANCLASDVIQVGQHLSLPSVPPLRPTFPPPPTPASSPTVLTGITKVPTSQGIAAVPGGILTPSPTSDITPPTNGPKVGQGETPTPTSPLASPSCLGAALVILFVALITGLILYGNRKGKPAGPNQQP